MLIFSDLKSLSINILTFFALNSQIWYMCGHCGRLWKIIVHSINFCLKNVVIFVTNIIQLSVEWVKSPEFFGDIATFGGKPTIVLKCTLSVRFLRV